MNKQMLTKVIRERAKAYDNLLTCTYEDCGNKFSTSSDLELHVRQQHQAQLTATEWWNKFKKTLLKLKDDDWKFREDSFIGDNTFTYQELVNAAKKVKQRNTR